MTTKTIHTNNGTILSYIESGQGHPVVLLHGFVGDHHYWNQVIQPLARNYRVIAIDLPGHGDSSFSDGVKTVEDYADEIASFVKQLNLDKISLIGHSLGGYITIAFAERHANLLARFALIHSTALPDTAEGKKGRLAGIEKIQTEGLSVFVDELIPKLFAPAYLADYEQITKEIGYKTTVQGAITALNAMKNRPDRVTVLEKSQVPVLLLAGSDDGVVPPKRAFTTGGANITQTTISGIGHMSMYEEPDRLIEELTKFLV